MPYSTANDVRIHYEISGEGPPMVLLHPSPFDHGVWLYQVNRFSTHFRVITIDMRGHGKSEDITAPFTVADLAADVIGVMNDEGAERAIVAGASFSAKVATLLAIEHGDRVAALVVVGAAGTSGRGGGHHGNRNEAYLRDGVPAVMPGHLAEGTTETFAQSRLGRYFLDTFAERGDWTKPMARVRVSEARAALDLTPRLREIGSPTLVINGEHDFSLSAGIKTAEQISGARQVTLPGAGHVCCLDDPIAFDAALAEFLVAEGLMSETRRLS